MSPASRNLPKHLAAYIVEQNYDSYTPEEHATWRYIMRRNRDFFGKHAVPIYLDGLKKTGIPIDRIPRINEMDECLAEFGYGAVCVRGFIPPAIFLEFQAIGIMPIAADMRNISNIGYTPAPDIVHEAAGHVPIVADPAYRAYLKQYGTIANKAIFSQEDVRLYEAIRLLSDIKENPDTPASETDRAQTLLDEATHALSYVSESAQVSRMGWWTIEYGLIGTPEKPKIYGAGLLSSVEESQNCLKTSVPKVPLTVDCVNQSFDITEQQPQLYIAPSLEQLPDSLSALEARMSYKIGGVHGLETTLNAQTINTVALNSGIEIGGQMDFFVAEGEEARFFKMKGPTQIGINGLVVPNQGHEYHAEGYSSPIGRFKNFADRCPSTLDKSTLAEQGIACSKSVEISFTSGFDVVGRLENMLYQGGRLVLMTFSDCTVSYGGKKYYQPEWGPFDMVIGESVSSVYSGPPDRDAFGSYEIGTASSSPARTSAFSTHEKAVFSAYSRLRDLRSDSSILNEENLELFANNYANELKKEWLLSLELAELVSQAGLLNSPILEQKIMPNLNSDNGRSSTTMRLIEKGIELINIQD